MNFRQWFDSRQAQGASLPGPTEGPSVEEEDAIITRVAAKVIQWQMTVPAILFLESVKPLNYIGAQTMVFFEPFVQTLFNIKEYDTFRIMMEKRENIERLLLKIEELDAEAMKKDKQAKAERRAAQGRRWWWPFGGKDGQPPPPTGTDGLTRNP